MALITLVNRYQLREQLSHKAGRQTFIAQDLLTDRLVVIKILSFGQGFQWDDHKLFEREANTLKNLDHPAIPRYLDYFEVDESDIRGFALVQTYIQAPTLETAIEEGRKFSEAEAIELANRILDILTYLHERHPPIVHRDIKPSNILIGNRSGNSIGDVYLVDFGSVQAVASKESGTITIVGSYGYIPLEQFGGQTTPASDLYSLGMTLIYLLTGTHPAELTQVNGQVNFTAEVSNRFRRWLEKMTQPYLDKRFDLAKLAQIALISEDGDYGDFEDLKPANTRVKFYRDRDKIEIVWPDIDREKAKQIDNIYLIPGILIGLLILTCIFSFFLSFSLGSWMSDIFSFSFYGILFTFFVIGPISTFIAFIMKQFIEKVDYKLIIDNGHISHQKITDRPVSTSTRSGDRDGRVIQHKSIVYLKSIFSSINRAMGHRNRSKMMDCFEGQTENSKTDLLYCHPRSQIHIVAYSPGCTFDSNLDSEGKNLRRDTHNMAPKLSLYCGSFEYQCPDRLSDAECWWLGKELSDFLNLELQVIIYPTPKVPPESSCGDGC
jgi:serine/threonine protein kinase